MSALLDHELAALALDSYQRGYFAGMPGGNGYYDPDGDGLGSTLLTGVAGGQLIATAADLGLAASVAADFYATAYLINGEVVISYRGSDHLHLEADAQGNLSWSGADGARVSALAAGGVPDQALLALDFYNLVADLYPGTPITLTGHSLGGALAAFVAFLKNEPAVVFDNTAFMAAVGAILTNITPGHGHVYIPSLAQKVFVDPAAPWDSFGTAEIRQIALSNDVAGVFRLPDDVDNVQMGQDLNWFAAHSMGLLTLALFARETHGVNGTWVNAANAVFSRLSTETLAESLGILRANGNPASGVMTEMIASTVLPGSDNLFGDKAAASLVDDMQDLGSVQFDDHDLSFFVDKAIQYAALQAKFGEIGPHGTGVLSYDVSKQVIGLDLTDASWIFAGTQYVVGGTSVDFSSLLNDGALSASEMEFLANGPGKLDHVLQGVGQSGWAGQVAVASQANTVEVRGTIAADNITGTAGNERFVLGSDSDTVRPGSGINWVDGGSDATGADIDTLVDEHAWADFQIEFDAAKQIYYLALRDSIGDPRIHIVENVERFRLGNDLFHTGNILNQTPEDIWVQSIAGQTGMAKLQWGAYGAGTVMVDFAAIDPNVHDRFTWEIVGGSSFYEIDAQGVVRAKATANFDWNFWAQRARYDTYDQWQNGQHSGLLTSLLGTQYGFTVKVTDAAGASRTENFFFYLQNGDRHVYGTPGNDLIWGDQSASDIIYGLGGDDDIYGFGGDDVIHGEGGDDNLYGGTGRDIIHGGDDDDFIQVGSYSTAHGDAGIDELVAMGDNNVLNGGDENDILRANGNGNVLQGGDGADELISAAGKWNTASYQNALSGVTLNYSGISLTGLGTGGEATGDTLTGIFDIVGSSHGDTIDMVLGFGMTLRAGGGSDILNVQITDYSAVYGEDGDDIITVTKNPYTNAYGTIYGGAGNDTISGHGELHGGTGADTITSAQGDHKIYLGVDNDVDTFVFSRMKGFDQVYDFTSIDKIKIGPGYKYDSFDDVMANAYQVAGAHVDIWFEGDTKITIMNFQKANLTADNFLFE